MGPDSRTFFSSYATSTGAVVTVSEREVGILIIDLTVLLLLRYLVFFCWRGSVIVRWNERYLLYETKQCDEMQFTLQRGDTLMRSHQMNHDLLEASLPLARGTGTWAGIRSKFARLFVIRFVVMQQRYLKEIKKDERNRSQVASLSSRAFSTFHLRRVSSCFLTEHPLEAYLQGNMTVDATFSMARFRMLPRGPRHVGQHWSLGRHAEHTMCPDWHWRIGGRA